MDFEFSEDHRILRDTVRDFARAEVAPGAADRDSAHKIEPQLISKMAEMGFFGICIPEEYGGADMGCVASTIVVEEISKACAGTGVFLSAHNSLCVDPVLGFGTDAQKKKYLPGLASGKTIGCFSLTESGSGSDAGSARCTATPDGDSWRVDGSKIFVTNGAEAGVVILFAVTDAEDKKNRLSAFIVEQPSDGLSIAKLEDKMGIRCTSTAEFLFENCPLPPDSLLGKRGHGLRVELTTLDGGRIGVAAQGLGIAAACLDASIEYAKQREQFNRPIGAFWAIQEKIANIAVEVEASRMLVYRAAWLKDQGRPYAYEAAQAKLFAAEACNRAASAAVQVYGGYGFCEDYPVERLYRDAKITELYEGTSEIHRLVIARTLLDPAAKVWETNR
ncbi:MAG: acyl-CoA dehydrogenase [Planctomycetes bacterium]|nr:acyl-CoA dehydrogenase [Planctomycetota bacterium]